MSDLLDPLISTKLRPSQTRPRLVPRPRLVEQLAREPERRLTLLCAPAGFGKTTLLSSWAHDRARAGHVVAWLALDRADNDPARFLTYLVAALNRDGDGVFGEGISAALHSTTPPPPEALTAILINELTALPGDIDLVLDDYHVIDSQRIHRIVELLVEHQPPGLHLVISSRTRPTLPLARLHARGQLAEMTATDLAFTRDETAVFLTEIMLLDLTSEHVTALAGVTEGWIAGLQIAALSMKDRGDLAGFIASFSGRHRGVFDFLAEEVLERQSASLRSFLLRTSILNSLTGPLCNAVTGRADGQEMLEELERENLFVVALDDERRWFRYHHLFADFLRGRLHSDDPQSVHAGHLSASDWYEEHGYLTDAIEHALAAPDHERAARVIEQESQHAWSRGEIPTVLGWLETLPMEVKRQRPRLLLQHGMALALTGRPHEVEPYLVAGEQEAETRAQEQNRRFLLGFAAAVRSWCARLRGDTEAAIARAREGLSFLPAEAGGIRAFAAVCLGDSLWTTGDLAAANDALAEATTIGRAAGHVYATISAMTLHARVQMERGQLLSAREILNQARQIVTEHRAELLPAAGAIHIGMGALHYEHNRLDEAESSVRNGIELAEHTRNVTDLVWGTVVLSRARWAQGDAEDAIALADKAERIARDYGADLEIAIAAAWRSRLHLSFGDVAEASRPVRSRVSVAGSAADAARTVDRIAEARLLLSEGQHHEALRLLDEPRKNAEDHGRARDLIVILSLSALAHWAANEPDLALSTLARALSLAEPEGYVRIFVDEGPPMATLLFALVEAERTGEPGNMPPAVADYARRLLAVLEQEDPATGSSPDPLPDPLTSREMDVLRLIGAGLSNREIAAQTFVSLGTVKTHINNLYGKLGVHRRTQALARARELGLLEDDPRR